MVRLNDNFATVCMCAIQKQNISAEGETAIEKSSFYSQDSLPSHLAQVTSSIAVRLVNAMICNQWFGFPLATTVAQAFPYMGFFFSRNGEEL